MHGIFFSAYWSPCPFVCSNWPCNFWMQSSGELARSQFHSALCCQKFFAWWHVIDSARLSCSFFCECRSICFENPGSFLLCFDIRDIFSSILSVKSLPLFVIARFFIIIIQVVIPMGNFAFQICFHNMQVKMNAKAKKNWFILFRWKMLPKLTLFAIQLMLGEGNSW